jgi:hypothetical protein
LWIGDRRDESFENYHFKLLFIFTSEYVI